MEVYLNQAINLSESSIDYMFAISPYKKHTFFNPAYNEAIMNHFIIIVIFSLQMKLQMKAMTATNEFEKKANASKYMNFMREKNINPIKPLLFQLPIGLIYLSFFGALREMSQVLNACMSLVKFCHLSC